jgi:DNA-binding NarL/FixJ family response regulator
MTTNKTVSAKLPRRVMVVDDDDAALYFMFELLREKGYEVVGCASGAEALKVAPSFDPDVILSDLGMPGMDGFALMREIKKTLPDVEVIIITGATGTHVSTKGFREGALDFLVKPATEPEILAALDRAFEKIHTLKAESGGGQARSAIKMAMEAVEMERSQMMESANRKLYKIILPQIEQMKTSASDENVKEGLDFIQELLVSLFSSTSGFTDQYSKLTSIEVQICNLLMRGKSSQEIADALNRSLDTIYDHQKKIRGQLGITNTRQSLGNYLRKEKGDKPEAEPPSN